MSDVLVMLPNNLGDVIMALPVLAGIKRNDPDGRITFFVEEGFEAGLINTPFCDAIYRFKRKTIRDQARTAEWKSAVAYVRETVQRLAQKRFDRCINLSQHPYASFIAALLGCPVCAGRHFLRAGNHALNDAWSQYLYAIPFARTYNKLHATDVYCRIAGVDSAAGLVSIALHRDERRRAEGFLRSNGLQPDAGGPILILQPGAAFASKRWPLGHFIRLGSLLAGEGYRLIVTGAPAEQAVAQALGDAISNAAVVTAGKLTFRETIALLPFAQGCVTGDTAVMHAAAALDRKVFALFGPTNPVETGPYGKGHHVFYGRCDERPCFCRECKTGECMKTIDPETVFSAIKGERVTQSRCDICRTVIREDGTVGLEPFIYEGPGLFHPAGAEIALRVIDPGCGATAVTSLAAERSLVQESTLFLNRIDQMAEALSEYLHNRSQEAIQRYERLHGENESAKGIGAFFAALLNIRLNSVGLLDPVAGVSESRAICMGLKSAISTVLAKPS
ncbi:MAG: glycosyltransferase family 9 protein [Chitinispirillaceae bacterium]|nr:glycosyltransferase family 9 protein [Chitinispirillaceae bacterium]